MAWVNSVVRMRVEARNGKRGTLQNQTGRAKETCHVVG